MVDDLPRRVAAGLGAAAPALLEAMAGAPASPLADQGLAHHHLRLPGTGLLARVPKHSQMGLGPTANLRYQAACFARAWASGHTPQLAGVLRPSAHLPQGALLVEEIIGRPATLPADLPALMQALARLHALPLPPADQRAPLLRAAEPTARLLREIDKQAVHLDDRRIAAASRQRIRAMRQVWRAPRGAAHCLIAFDAHPGNFIVRPNGQAVLVDLEKARYGLPALDVAHATLYTSTTWDARSPAVLGSAAVAQAYTLWQRGLGAAAGSPAQWLALRRAMWLWSVTWCASWLATQPAVEASSGALRSHVRERVLHYLAAGTVETVADGFDELQRLLQPGPTPAGNRG